MVRVTPLVRDPIGTTPLVTPLVSLGNAIGNDPIGILGILGIHWYSLVFIYRLQARRG